MRISDWSSDVCSSDLAELQQLNARIVHLMDYEDVRERLPSGVTVEAWEAIRPNLSTVAEAADWWQVVEGPVSAEIAAEDRAYLAEAARVLEPLPFDSGVRSEARRVGEGGVSTCRYRWAP